MGKLVSTTGNLRWQQLRRHFSETFSQACTYRRRDHESAQVERPEKKRSRDAYRYILLLLVLILVPMDLHFVLIRQVLPAVAGLLLLAVVLADIWLLGRTRPTVLSPAWLLLFSITLIFLAVLVGQQYMLFWLYPLLITLPILLRRPQSMLLGALSASLLWPLIFAQFDRNTATVLCFTMALTWLISSWLVFAVNVQSRRLKDMAITDPLTGAYNRRFLEQQALLALHSFRRYRHPSALLLIDIDNFKRINDQYGHAQGDDALKLLVEVVSGRLRAVDTVCRFGGDEFVVLLNETDIGAAVAVAEQLRKLVETSRTLPEGSLTVSIGICGVGVADNLDHWLNLADTALYLAKRNGRNRVEIAKPLTKSREPLAKTVSDWR